MIRSFVVTTSSKRGITLAARRQRQSNGTTTTRRINRNSHFSSSEASSSLLLKKRNLLQTTTTTRTTAAALSTTASSSNPTAATLPPSSYIAAAATTTSSSNTSSIINESSLSSSYLFPIFMAVAAASCFGSVAVTDGNNNDVGCWQNKDINYYTRMEEATDDDDDDDDDEDENTEDPYENLPEKDEPTHCSICMTYRQGPCRPFWRKVEACTKDNELKKDPEGSQQQQQQQQQQQGETNEGGKENEEEEEEGMIPDTPCLKYMLPWIDCATGYKNLYSLIELDTNFMEGIAILEKEAVQTLCWAPGKEPKVNWTEWQRYVLSHEDWKMPPKGKSIKQSDDNKKVSLWKTLDQSQDPMLVEIRSIVPTIEGSGILECAYAVDQDGNVLGFTYGTKPSEAAASSSSTENSNNNGEGDDNGDKNQNDNDTSSVVELKIKLLPNRTRSIIIKASYTQPKQDEDEGDLDAHVYQSGSFSLKKMANIKE